MAGGVAEEIRDRAHVDVGEAEQPPRKVRRIVVGAKDRAELLIEDALYLLTDAIALADPVGELGLGLAAVDVLVVLDQGGQHLQPVRVLLELRVVQRLDFVLEEKEKEMYYVCRWWERCGGYLLSRGIVYSVQSRLRALSFRARAAGDELWLSR